MTAKSNLLLIGRAFSDIIIERIDKDLNGRSSSMTQQRATFKLIDGSFLSITEILKDGVIDFFHYDWYSDRKQVIAKFHSEPHEDEKLHTATEPFHIHVPDKHGLVKEKRLPNEKHRDLMSILELIRIQIIK